MSEGELGLEGFELSGELRVGNPAVESALAKACVGEAGEVAF